MIRKITPAGVVSTLAGSAGISGANDGTGIYALFDQPFGTAVDSSGNVYVADSGNSTIRQITPGGVVTTIAGTAGIAGWRDGSGSAALFNQPRSLVLDAAGDIFVADTGNKAIRRIDPGGTVTTLSLVAAPASVATPPAVGTPTPTPTTPSAATPTSGGGGGAIGSWFAFALSLLTLARGLTRKR
jgi:streptogramin lyase